jgi:hypothetical protein
MLGTLLATVGLPMLMQVASMGLKKINNPLAQGAATALDQVSEAMKGGGISPDEVKEANRHIEAMAEIDSADVQVAIAQVNQSLRAEVASEDPYVRRMRPTFGYIMAVTWAAQMLALAWTILSDPAKSGDVINSMSSLSTIWSVGLAVLGVYVYKRSEEKGVKSAALPGPLSMFSKS